jgi:predicted transcriptional regulator
MAIKRRLRVRAPEWLLFAMRAQKYETITCLCKRLRTSRQSLYRYLREPENMPLGKMEALATALGMSLTQLGTHLRGKTHDGQGCGGTTIENATRPGG